MNKRISYLILSACLVVSCVSQRVPRAALMWNQEALATRETQTRSFNATDEKALLVAAAGLLQDMGYSIEESETDLGLMVGSKDREAGSKGQAFGASLIAVLAGTRPVYDKEQKIRVCIVTRESRLVEGGILLRATFQRLVWNNQGVLWKREPVNDPSLYVEFFDRLSKAVFLEANAL